MTYTLESIERAAAEYKAARDAATPGWKSEHFGYDLLFSSVTGSDGSKVCDETWWENGELMELSRSTELPEMVEWLVAKLAEARDVCRDARRYVAGAYECAFPDQSENDQVLTSIDAFLKATEAP